MRGTFEPKNDNIPLSVPGFIAQLVRASHRHRREVTDSNPVEVLYAIAKIAFITARIIASLDFVSTVHYMINFTYHFVQWNLKCEIIALIDDVISFHSLAHTREKEFAGTDNLEDLTQKL